MERDFSSVKNVKNHFQNKDTHGDTFRRESFPVSYWWKIIYTSYSSKDTHGNTYWRGTFPLSKMWKIIFEIKMHMVIHSGERPFQCHIYTSTKSDSTEMLNSYCLHKPLHWNSIWQSSPPSLLSPAFRRKPDGHWFCAPVCPSVHQCPSAHTQGTLWGIFFVWFAPVFLCLGT